jgi:hypothetical protein
MSAVIRKPEKPNEDDRQAAVNAMYLQQIREEHEIDSRQNRINWFANSVLILVIAAAFVAVGWILSPAFTGF